MSQMVGTQAVLNILNGERYKIVAKEVKDYLHGRYGKTPAPVNEEVRKKILGDVKPIEGRYAETLPTDTFEKAQEKLGDLAKTEEDVLSYIAFPSVAEKFLTDRKAKEENVWTFSIEEVK